MGGKFKAILMTVLAALALQTFTSLKADAAPVPWPWPWAVGCPIKWDQLNNEWRLPDLHDGSVLSIAVSRVSGSSSYVGIHVRRSDPGVGIHSDGFKVVPKNTRNVLVYMTPQRKGFKPYFIEIGMYLYQTYEVDSCDSDKVVTLMSIMPLKQGEPQPDAYNYVLDPQKK